MIIVEGPDGSGKSTLIEQLKHARRSFKSLNGGVGGTTATGWSEGRPPVVEYVTKVLWGLSEEQGLLNNPYPGPKLIAFDRFHLSEWVYGPILRQHQTIENDELLMFSNYLRMKRIPVILCMPNFATTLKNVSLEGRDRPGYQTEGFLHQAYKGFQTVAPWATIVYDYTRDPLPAI